MAGERRRGLARSAKLAGLPMGIMARRAAALGREFVSGARGGQVDDELIDQAAEQVFAVLGELKGGAMKLGQALSVAEAGIPPRFADRYREALIRLQAEAPPMPTSDAHRMLDQQLGTQWRKRFAEFEDKPIAAASIGQVHRGTWPDGRTVAVKIQYPSAEQALRADLKMLQMFSGMFNALLPGTDTRQMVDEFIARTDDELDYRIEANYQRIFAQALAGNPQFFVPRVVASSPKVIVAEWMTGTPLSRVIKDGSKQDRDRAGMLLAEFALSSPARVGHLHCDPHPGNFQLLPDGRLGILDFGASIPIPGGIPPMIGELARHALAEDYDRLAQALAKHGFVRPGARLTVEPIKRLVSPIVAEFDGEHIHFTRELLQGHFERAFDLKNMSVSNALATKVPPDRPELIMLGRVFGGLAGVCAQLDAEGPFIGLVEKWLPGFAESDEAA